MKKQDESQIYLENKKEIFNQILSAIMEGQKAGSKSVYIKDIQVMSETVDAVASREEWPTCIEKALDFFESIEEYESCQICKDLLSEIKNK